MRLSLASPRGVASDCERFPWTPLFSCSPLSLPMALRHGTRRPPSMPFVRAVLFRWLSGQPRGGCRSDILAPNRLLATACGRMDHHDTPGVRLAARVVRISLQASSALIIEFTIHNELGVIHCSLTTFFIASSIWSEHDIRIGAHRRKT
jgi:hypothetical protein